MDHLSDVVQIRLRLLVLALNLIYLLLFYVELILLTRKVLVQIYSRILFGLNILLQLQLFPSALLKLSFGLKQFLLLLHGLLHDFSALEELTLHVFDFFEQFLLIRLFFLLFSVLFFKLRNQTLSFLFCELVLLLNPQLLLFKFLHDCTFFSFQLILHRFHLFFVFNVNSSFNFHYAAGARHSAGTALCSHSASSHLRKLLSQPRDFVVELADHCVFRIFVDSGLILNLLGARSISQRRNGFVGVVVGRADCSDHDCLCVATQ